MQVKVSARRKLRERWVFGVEEMDMQAMANNRRTVYACGYCWHIDKGTDFVEECAEIRWTGEAIGKHQKRGRGCGSNTIEIDHLGRRKGLQALSG